MTSLLGMIYCWLEAFWFRLTDWTLGLYDSVLSVVDVALASFGDGGIGSLPTIANEYAWILGATGMSQALAVIAAALLVRFGLQSIPFVRWGS